MILPRIGDEYPMGGAGRHASHRAVIVAVDLHGEPSWEDRPLVPPTIAVRCSCGLEFQDDLIEAAPNAPVSRRRSA